MNEDTGLPELPEGYFWRVSDKYGIFPWVEVRRKFWFWSTQVDGMWSPKIFPKSEDKIAYLANRLLENISKVRQMDTDAKRLVGDYPPRKLER